MKPKKSVEVQDAERQDTAALDASLEKISGALRDLHAALQPADE